MINRLKYDKVLLDCIKEEKNGRDYICPDIDKTALRVLMGRINDECGTHIKYLAEIDAFDIQGAGKIVSQHIFDFSSQTVIAILISQMVSDKIENCDKILIQLYSRFKASNEYNILSLSPPNHISVRYDNAFKRLKSKEIVDELVELAHHPIDVFYLPLTMRMLASWKIPELEAVFLRYSLDPQTFTFECGNDKNKEKYRSLIAFIERELLMTSLEALKYYPSESILNHIKQYISNSDPDIRYVARKTMKTLLKHVH